MPEKPKGLSSSAGLMISPDVFHKSHPRNSYVFQSVSETKRMNDWFSLNIFFKAGNLQCLRTSPEQRGSLAE